MPGALAVPLLILVECLNLRWPLGVGQHAARCRRKGPAGVAGKRVCGRLELMLYHVQEQRALPSQHCPWLPEVHHMPRSHYPT